MRWRITFGVFFGIVVIIIGFAFFVPRANRGGEQAPITETATLSPAVSFMTKYAKGVHTIEGFVTAPTPCTEVSADARVASGTPETISVDILMPPDTGICLQVITELPFKVSVKASTDAVIEVFVNGARVSEARSSP
ncbi:hypothetical protein A3H77_01390 [Candidatus Kaiserbacteria bacterium RIFCSPLOWO2_02_FULL_56_11]|uniref:Uncharacterized protein n=2 Tax=Candidatus Kaiseribacteriota TaxID=1752734 RepID=A0A1F6E407_9BACT|nr:MAG: hypothetical protein A3C95_01595 [Candidatus Kaiserbacteria bacterium RIFCSPHIGHO2_02_FULL_56_30]OGG72039.1 MAG: hypothetical protein A3E65_00160 [Candidatus Kaiserbacteria bacterium RIFCSPHIGHO2_12_FULL_56_13]OGG82327.1 MAG: hypothetical protein A3H77_01390 [Candidatus Kaiserbacteria bacterium RIFCSPLOWO2_02_FULL_56_11]